MVGCGTICAMETTTQNDLRGGGRLFALDALRGLDMLLLTVIGPLTRAAQKGWHCFPSGFMQQFEHGWECFTLWDIIMPLFIFVCGAAVPLALTRRMECGGFWRHVAWRVALLWVLGGLVQGNWISLDPLAVSPFSNTLQSIAVGYLAVAAVMYTRSRALSVAVPVACAAIYTAILAAFGDYTEFGNAAFKVDAAVLKAMLPEGSRWVTRPSHYTWFLTSLMFAAMAFAGYHSTRILQSVEGTWRKAGALAAYGAALSAVGAVSLVWIPCIKPIYTLSFTALAMGICALSYAGLYALNDVLGCRRGWGFVLFFGRMALAAYFISHFFRPVLDAAVKLVGTGVCSYLPATMRPFANMILFVACLVLCMFAWRRLKAK